MPKKKTTRNAQGAGTIRQRSDGRWEARYSVGHDPGTGKQVQRSIYGATQKEVRLKLQRVCADIDNGIYTEPSKMTIGLWLDIWLEEYARQGIKPLTFVTYKTQCEKHIKPAIGSVRLAALNTHTIQSFYNGLGTARTDALGLSPKTIKNIHGVLHRALCKAVELRYINFNPADACTLPRMDKTKIKPLEETAVAAFLKALEGEQYSNLFMVTLFTGLRESEVLGLTWDCVDFQNQVIRIDKQLQKEKHGNYYLSSTKSGKDRQLSPAPSVLQIRLNERRKQNESRLIAGPIWSNPFDLVFTDETGKNLVQRTVVKHYKRIVSGIGLPEARFHDLRHTYAVMALQAGDDVKSVQEALGHYAAAFTLDVYGHVTERMKKESAQRMEGIIKGIQSCKG